MTKTVRILELKRLSREAKENIYNKLINGDYSAEIDINTSSEFYRGCNVDFYADNHHESDLCVNHFGYNFYMRPNRMIKGTRYKTFDNALRALKVLLKNRCSNFLNTSNLRIYNNKSVKSVHIFNIEL